MKDNNPAPNQKKESEFTFFPDTKELLESEITMLTHARDGVGKVYNYLKLKGKGDEYLSKLYHEFDRKLKSHNQAISALREETLRNCVAG